MASPAAGVLILVPFPFSDLSQTKLRPAVVLADAGRGDSILCQVTSKPYGDPRAIQLDDASFRAGSLRATSYAPWQAFHRWPDLDCGAGWPAEAGTTPADRRFRGESPACRCLTSAQMTRKTTVLHLKTPFVYPFCGRKNAECRAFQAAHPGQPAARNLDGLTS